MQQFHSYASDGSAKLLRVPEVLSGVLRYCWVEPLMVAGLFPPFDLPGRFPLSPAGPFKGKAQKQETPELAL